MKKIKKIIGAVPEQNSSQTAKQTNVQTYIGYFIGPSIRGSNKISSHILAKCFMFIESWIEKNSEQAEKRTNVQRVFHRTFTSWIQNINTQVLEMFLMFIEPRIIEMVLLKMFMDY